MVYEVIKFMMGNVKSISLKEGGKQVIGSTDLALRSARFVDLSVKSSGFTDFENTVDRGSAVIFDVDSGLRLSYVPILGPKRNLDHRKFGS